MLGPIIKKAGAIILNEQDFSESVLTYKGSKKDLVRIHFFFPKISRDIKNKRKFVELLMAIMRKEGSIEYAGYLKEKDLHKNLVSHIGNGDFTQYKLLSAKQKSVITQTINGVIKKSHNALPHPDLPVFVFLYPWFSEGDDRFLFRGTMGIAAYYTMYLFIDLNALTQSSLKQTIAHEWSHLVFYRYYP